jgi:hypothetical protein
MKSAFSLCLIMILAGPLALGQVMSGSVPNPAYSTLQLWLRADAGAAGTDGAAVLTWTNQTTSPFAAGNATAALIGLSNAPAYVAASGPFHAQPAVAFNGANQGLDIADPLGALLANGSYTAFAVVATAGPNTTNTWHYAQTILANNSNTLYLYSVDPWVGAPVDQYLDQFCLQNSVQGNWAAINSPNLVTNDVAYVLSLSSAGTNSGGTRLYVNGLENDDATPEAAFIVSSNWNLGYQSGATRYFHGQVAELLIYQGALADSDRLNVTAYLGAKYGIAVSPLAVASPTNDPPAGIYVGAQTVTIASDAGATIIYTTDGSNPNHSPTAVASFNSNVDVEIPAGTNMTILSFATKPGCSLSPVTRSIYNTVVTNAPITTVSEVRTLANQKRVLYVDGKPFQACGGQMRVDTWRNYAGYTDAEMAALNIFSWPSNLNMNVVQVPIYWRDIETAPNQFDWTTLQWAIQQCSANSLRMEVLWFGTDVTGRGGTSIQPQYILDDTATFPLMVSSNGLLEANQLAAADGTEHTLCKEYATTMAAEQNALFQLMNYLQANDTNHVVIGLQIEDEAGLTLNANPPTDRCHCPLCNTLYATGDFSSSLQFCQQRLAVYLNRIATAVKMSPYKLWTRVNFVDSFTNYDEDVSQLQNLATNVDLIAWDPYGETQLSRFTTFTNASADGLSRWPNFPFASEEPGGQDASCRPKIIDTFAANGAGCEFYRVDTYSTNAGVDNYLINPNGTDARAWTDSIRQTFGLLRRVMSKTAVLSGGTQAAAQIEYFNSFGSTMPIYHGTNLIAGTGIQYTTTAAGVGMAFADGDEILLLSDQAGIFRLNDGPGVFENGYYDGNGHWVAVSVHAATTNADGSRSVSLSAGTPYEVVKFIPANAKPVINSSGWRPNGSFQMNFSGLQGSPFRVLSTNLLLAPVSTWPVVGTGSFAGSVITFTDATTTASARFYRVASP